MLFLTTRRSSGMTLTEMMVSVGLVGFFLSTLMGMVFSIQSVFVESQVISDINSRAQRTMERIVALSSQAITDDWLYTTLQPDTGIDAHILRFQLIDSVDVATTTPVYNADRAYIAGPDSGFWPTAGIIVGRGAFMQDVWDNGAGPDGLLGTADDLTNATTATGNQVVEILVPSTYAPSTGEMFQVDITPAPIGRFLTFTLRLNAVEPGGGFAFAEDLVFTQTVALRQ